MLCERGEAILAALRRQLERRQAVLADGPETVTFVVKLNAGGWPRQTLFRPEFTADEREARGALTA